MPGNRKSVETRKNNRTEKNLVYRPFKIQKGYQKKVFRLCLVGFGSIDYFIDLFICFYSSQSKY